MAILLTFDLVGKQSKGGKNALADELHERCSSRGSFHQQIQGANFLQQQRALKAKSR